MKIALDYDRTFTADPAFWERFVKMAKEAGHDVRIVTYRYEDASRYEGTDFATNNDDIIVDAFMLDIPIVFTNHQAKQEHWKADIWIDDNPKTILEDGVGG